MERSSSETARVRIAEAAVSIRLAHGNGSKHVEVEEQSHIKEQGWLLSLSRGRWTVVSQMNVWMRFIDPSTLVHKELVALFAMSLLLKVT